jgi:hypothetical protein
MGISKNCAYFSEKLCVCAGAFSMCVNTHNCAYYLMSGIYSLVKRKSFFLSTNFSDISIDIFTPLAELKDQIAALKSL